MRHGRYNKRQFVDDTGRGPGETQVFPVKKVLARYVNHGGVRVLLSIAEIGSGQEGLLAAFNLVADDGDTFKIIDDPEGGDS